MLKWFSIGLEEDKIEHNAEGKCLASSWILSVGKFDKTCPGKFIFSAYCLWVNGTRYHFCSILEVASLWQNKFCDMVTVFNGHGQLTSNTETEVRYPRCQEVSSEESWTETVTVSVINVACWFVLNWDFSCSLFYQAALSRLNISFSRCTYWDFEGNFN